jgi:superfamily II DNA or RNA helicase
VLLQMPTGSGKAVVLAAIAASASAKGRRVLVVVHRRELLHQAAAKLKAAGVQHGFFAPGCAETDDIVQLGSIQTLVGRLDRLPPFDLIVLDEAHHAVAPQWARLLAAQPRVWVLGFTATPERADGKGLGKSCGGVFDGLVIGPSVAELITDGYLVGTRVFVPPEVPDLSGVRIRAGDYDVAALAEMMDRPPLVGNAVEHYARITPGLPAIAFCATVQHALDVAAAFRATGWRAVAVHGGMPTQERDEALTGLASGAQQIVCSCDLISEGLDVPSVGVVILLRPTQSLSLHLQQIGRGLRPSSGKQHLIVLDHAGNTLRHGFAEDPRRWSLEGRLKRELSTTPALRRCPECGLVQDGTGRTCSGCGSELPTRPRLNVPKTTAGALKEVRRVAPTIPYSDIRNGTWTREQLRVFARARNYKRGWVQHRLREQAEREQSSGDTP